MFLTSIAGAGSLPEMVWELNRAQNRIGKGEIAATLQAKKQFDQIEQAVSLMGAKEWEDARNTRAAAIYLLCGGSSPALRRFVDLKLFPEQSLQLMSGSMAYSEGRSEDASKLLLPLEAKTFSNVLGGHIALVQGALTSKDDETKATRFFDLARLMMPDSLVEEAALRREIAILDAARSPEKYLLLGQRYVSQYSASPYAKSFWASFSAATVKAGLKLDAGHLNKFQNLLSSSSPKNKLDVSLAIAREAILNAQNSLAQAQIQIAQNLATSSSDVRRLKFYTAATKFVLSGFEESASEIQRVEPSSLSRVDADFLKIVTAASAKVGTASERPGSKSKNASDEPIGIETSVGGAPIIDTAEQALAQIDGLLRRAP
jgi:chemotaxis protein MotC